MKEKLEKVLEEFKEQTKKDCYNVKIIEEEPQILDDKIGGKPYLPLGEEYPKDEKGEYLALLLQINLKNIDLEGYPKEGILEIFTDKDVDYPCQYVIKYFKEGLEYQEELPNVDLSYYIVSKGYKIELEKSVAYMPISDYRFEQVFLPIFNRIYETDLKAIPDIEEYLEDYDWYENLPTNYGITIGGYAEFTQNDPRNYQKIDKDECLFKIDSAIDLNKISIGDAGILFVLISKEEIEKKEFNKALVDWDCF